MPVNVNATLSDGISPDDVATLFDYVTNELEVEGITVSPGCAYERVPDQKRFLNRHGRTPEPRVIAWQDRLTPLWKRCSGGCHLNRKIDDLIRQGGFNIAELQTGYAKGPRPMAFMYEGRARNPKQRPGIS